MSKSPTEWCVCDVSKTYSIVSGTDACPPSITNGPTMTLQDVSKSSPVPSPTASCVTSEPGPGWNIDHDKIVSMVDDYCTKKINDQKGGDKVSSNWPGRCSSSTDPNNKDPNTIAANFRITGDCPNPAPLDHSTCVNSFGKIIDTCKSCRSYPFRRLFSLSCNPTEVSLLSQVPRRLIPRTVDGVAPSRVIVLRINGVWERWRIQG